MTATTHDALDRLVAHVRNGTTDTAAADLRVPVAHFVSEERAAQERAVLRSHPLIVAHESELAEPGSFVTRDVLGTSVLLTRQDDGSVRAFRNMCRHRGGVVENEASGNKRVFACRYHGWSYDRDGSLRHVPYESDFDTIDHACNALHDIHCETRCGFVWVTLEGPPAGGVGGFLGQEVETALASFGFGDSVVFLDETIAVDINWKLVVDGTIDMLHNRFLHPTTVGKYFLTNKAVWREYGRHGQVFTARRRLERLAAEHAGEGPVEGPVENPWSYMATNLVVYPNSLVIAAPDHVELWTVWPDPRSASRATINFRFLVRAGLLDDAMRERMTRSWEILREATVNDDLPMEATIQANALAAPDGTFLYGRCEVPCQHLHRQLQLDIDRLAAAAAHG